MHTKAYLIICMITLCTYAQQGYAFGHISLCIHVCGKKTGYLTTWKSLIGTIYCSLIKFNRQKRSLSRQVIRSEKEIRRHSINGMGKGSPENCITVGHASSTCIAASCAVATAVSADLQYCYRYMYSMYWQCLAHTGYVFCGTLVLYMVLECYHWQWLTCVYYSLYCIILLQSTLYACC